MEIQSASFREKVLALSYQAWSARALQIAVRLKIFEVVEASDGTAEKIARISRLEPRAAELFLNALAGVGLIEKRGRRFRNSAAGREIFLPRGGKYLGDIVGLSDRGWGLWGNLEKALRTGKALDTPDFFKTRSEAVGAFIRAMDNTAKGHADLLARSLSLKGRRRLLDIGGGSGAFSLAFLKQNSRLQVTLFDLPQTLRMTREFVKKSPFRNRIRYQAGDLERDGFQGWFDAIFVSHILHGLSEKQNLELLKNIYWALEPKGLVILQDFFLSAD